MIKYYLHEGSTYIVPQYASEEELARFLSIARQDAYDDMAMCGREHAIYGVKHYDPETGDITSTDIYDPAVLLDDVEFDKRTKAQMKKSPGCYILAVHAMR